MDKYEGLSTITKEFLDGKLTGLEIHYDDDSHMTLMISYKVNSFFTLEYEVTIDKNEKKVKFVSHGSRDAMDRVRLDREPAFDTAVSKFFFPSNA